jgi:hypothetical protein
MDTHKVILVDNLDEQLDKYTIDFLQFRNLAIKQMILKGEMSYAQIGAQFFPPLNKSSVGIIARDMGIHKVVNHRNNWTDDETKILKENFERLPIIQVMTLLTRSRLAIKIKAEQLGLRGYKFSRIRPFSWTEGDMKYLKENYNKMDVEEISKRLNKSAMSIRKRASELHLKSDHWIDYVNVDEYIKKNYLIKPLTKMCKEINISQSTLTKRAVKLGISKNYQKPTNKLLNSIT